MYPETSRLYAGEASSIALALGSVDPLLVIDEKKGRRMAGQLEIEIIDTVGVRIEAKNAGYIDGPETPVARLESADFRMNDFLKTVLLRSDDSVQ